jgi:RNA polymerase sigma-70 factor (ECF subfamily)
MSEEPTTVIIERYLNVLPGDPAAEPIVRELLEGAVGRLRLLCATLLHKSYPRLTRPPLNLETEELLGIQGLTHAEAPTVVGVSENTVQRRLNRARLLLAQRLADLRPRRDEG